MPEQGSSRDTLRQDAPPGALDRWLALGAFPMLEGDTRLVHDYLADSGGEAEVEPDVGSGGQGLTWSSVRPDSAGFLRFARILMSGRRGNSFSYAHSYLYAPRAGEYLIRLETANDVVAYVNGRRALVREGAVPQRLRTDSITGPLVRGWNRLLVKLGNRTGPYLLRATLGDRQGRAVEDAGASAARPTALPASYPASGIGNPALTSSESWMIDEAGRLWQPIHLTGAALDTGPLSLGLADTVIDPYAVKDEGRVEFRVPVEALLRGATRDGSVEVQLDELTVRWSAGDLLARLSHPIVLDGVKSGPAVVRQPERIPELLAGFDLGYEAEPPPGLIRILNPGYPDVRETLRWAAYFSGDSLIDRWTEEDDRALLGTLLGDDRSAYFRRVTRVERSVSDLTRRLKRDTLWLLGHAHIDAAWLWPRDESRAVARNTLRTALALGERFPEYRFVQNSPAYLHWIERDDPALFENIRQAVEAGRWTVAGGGWVEADLNLPSGESLVRHQLFTQRYFESRFGRRARLAWLLDVFGHSWSFPQILRRSGYERLVIHKVRWSDRNRFPHTAFWWEGVDGSRIQTYVAYLYDHNMNGEWLARDYLEHRAATDAPHQLILFGVSDHGGGPTREMLERARALQRLGPFPALAHGLPEVSLDKIFGALGEGRPHGARSGGPPRWTSQPAERDPDESVPDRGVESASNIRSGSRSDNGTLAPQRFPEGPRDGSESMPGWLGSGRPDGAVPQTMWPIEGAADSTIPLPTWRGELYVETHRGAYTSQARIKRWNRRLESRLEIAEKLATLAWTRGLEYPAAELDSAWRVLLFNQFHDILAGSSIASVYAEAGRDFGAADSLAKSVIRRSLERVAAEMDTRGHGRRSVVVFNALSWPRGGLVALPLAPTMADSALVVRSVDGRRLPSAVSSDSLVFVADSVPSLGFATFWVVPATPSVERGPAQRGRDGGPGFAGRAGREPPRIAESAGSRPAPGRPASTSMSKSPPVYELENRFLRARIDPETGNLSSLLEKASGRELLGEGREGNRLLVLRDSVPFWEAWNLGWTGETWEVDSVVEIRRVGGSGDGSTGAGRPFAQGIRVTRAWGDSRFEQTYWAYADEPGLLIESDVDWRESRKMLKAAFPLSTLADTLWAEIPYAAIGRPVVPITPYDSAKFEAPMRRWIDASDTEAGVTIANDSHHGYDVHEGDLRISLLRAPRWPDPSTDRGRHRFRYVLYPHAGDWRAGQSWRRGAELNVPLVATWEEPHEGNLGSRLAWFESSDPGVVVTALKKAEAEDAVVMRLVELAGRPGSARLSWRDPVLYAWSANLLEDHQATLSVADSGPADAARPLRLDLSPFEIRTLLLLVEGAGPPR